MVCASVSIFAFAIELVFGHRDVEFEFETRKDTPAVLMILSDMQIDFPTRLIVREGLTRAQGKQRSV